MVVPSSIVTFPPSADNAISKDASSVSPVDTTDKAASFVIVSAVNTNPSIVKSVVASNVVALTVVNVAEAAVAAPIITPSIAPSPPESSISMFAVAVKSVNVPAAAVVPPMAPGSAIVLPATVAALRLATTVVD